MTSATDGWTAADSAATRVARAARELPVRALLGALPGALLAALLLAAAPAMAAPTELTVYSSRHYAADGALFDRFEAETGIAVTTVQVPDTALAERLKREGAGSPADLVWSADPMALTRLARDGLLRPVTSPELAAAVPAGQRDPENRWYGVTLRARVFVVPDHPGQPDPGHPVPERYEDLSSPDLAGLIYHRSGQHAYSTSLAAALTVEHGADWTRRWARGVAANLARPAEGNDIDQIRAVASLKEGVAVVNHYYYVRLAQSADPGDHAIAERVRVIFPNQRDRGAFVTVSGAGVLRGGAHPDAARRLIEFLVGEEAQTLLATGNHEFPVRPGIPLPPALRALGSFRTDPRPVAAIGAAMEQAEAILAEDGWR